MPTASTKPAPRFRISKATRAEHVARLARLAPLQGDSYRSSGLMPLRFAARQSACRRHTLYGLPVRSSTTLPRVSR